MCGTYFIVILLLLFITRIFSEENVYNFVNDLMKKNLEGKKTSKSGGGWMIKLRKSYMRKDKEQENREKIIGSI